MQYDINQIVKWYVADGTWLDQVNSDASKANRVLRPGPEKKTRERRFHTNLEDRARFREC